MTIAFPLDFPSLGVAAVRITQNSVVAVSRSPFTGKEQTQEHPGQWFEAEISIPPMYRADYAEWDSFFLQLNGRAGSFLLGDPSYRRPRGTITGALVNGTNSVRSKTLSIKSMTSDNANLVVNPGFELGDVSWSKGASWTIVNDAAHAYSGSYEAQRAANASSSALRSTAIACAPGQNYIAEAYIKLSSGATGNGLVRITTFDAAGAETVVANGNAITSTSYSLSTVIATIPAGAVTVKAELVGANTAGTLYVDDISLKLRTTILKSDYIQLGSGSTARLHKVINNATADGSGNATLDIWPALTASYSDGAVVTINSPVGVFKLVTNQMAYEAAPGQIFSGMVCAARSET